MTQDIDQVTVFDSVVATDFAQLYITDPDLGHEVPASALPQEGFTCSAPRDDFLYVRLREPSGPIRLVLRVGQWAPDRSYEACELRLTSRNLSVFTWAFERSYEIDKFQPGRYRTYVYVDTSRTPCEYRIHLQPITEAPAPPG